MEGRMSKRTPGPWHYAYEGSGLHSIYPDGSSEAVATAENSKEDARLIAAAPDLLDALVEVMLHVATGSYVASSPAANAVAGAFEAIAKATGMATGENKGDGNG